MHAQPIFGVELYCAVREPASPEPGSVLEGTTMAGSAPETLRQTVHHYS